MKAGRNPSPAALSINNEEAMSTISEETRDLRISLISMIVRAHSATNNQFSIDAVIADASRAEAYILGSSTPNVAVGSPSNTGPA